MVPVGSGKFEFRPDTLVVIRGQLGLSQSKMAKLLGVPANTLSRWETGTTTPDADSLAAVYSVAVEHGVTPTLFSRRRPVSKRQERRSRLLVMWDFQNLSVSVADVPPVNVQLREELDRRFGFTSYRRFKAFAHPMQSAATDELVRLGWRVREDDDDIDEEIISQSRSDGGQEPADTILVLITQDGDFVDLLRDLKSDGVAVFLMSPTRSLNQALVACVGTAKSVLPFPVRADSLFSATHS